MPGDWTSCPLEDACDIQTGPSDSVTRTNRKATAGTGIAVISAQSIGELTIVANQLDWVDQRTAERLRRFRLIEGDVVITRLGPEPRHALIGNDQAGSLLGGSGLRLRARPGLQPEYLSYYLEHPAIRDRLTRQVGQRTVTSLSKSRIGQLPMVFPALLGAFAAITVPAAETLQAPFTDNDGSGAKSPPPGAYGPIHP